MKSNVIELLRTKLARFFDVKLLMLGLFIIGVIVWIVISATQWALGLPPELVKLALVFVPNGPLASVIDHLGQIEIVLASLALLVSWLALRAENTALSRFEQIPVGYANRVVLIYLFSGLCWAVVLLMAGSFLQQETVRAIRSASAFIEQLRRSAEELNLLSFREVNAGHVSAFEANPFQVRTLQILYASPTIASVVEPAVQFVERELPAAIVSVAAATVAVWTVLGFFVSFRSGLSLAPLFAFALTELARVQAVGAILRGVGAEEVSTGRSLLISVPVGVVIAGIVWAMDRQMTESRW